MVRRRRAALMASTALQAVCALVLGIPAQAQPAPNARPVGGQVVAGNASISQSPDLTTITQSSQRAAVNWQGFDVGAQQTVQFAQPSASATTLNRVIGPNPSQIAGRIDANGQVILVNQDGVTFYKGAQVNAAGLVVSAGGISNQNFIAGRLVFDQPAAANSRIENQGNITVKQAGLAALVAPQVANSGVINARLGHVVLAGARAATLDLYGDGLVSIDVTQQVTKLPLGPDGKPVTALVTNTGTVLADGGTVRLTAQAVDGIVQNLVAAGGTISAASVGDRTGKIVLDGIGGSITIAGQLSTQGVAAGTKGGQIEAVADGGVTLAGAAVLNASGSAGGGTVAVGTTLARAKGGPSVKAKQIASSVTIAAGAQIAADATEHGDGGRVAVLSSGNTEMDGAISAKGGPTGGDGGFVEVSGQTLGLTGEINVSAPIGATGTILLDPGTLDIIDSAGPTGSLDGSISASGTLAFNVPDTTSTGSVTDFKIDQLGSLGNVVLQATTLLDVRTGTNINVLFGLTLQSGNTLMVEPGVSIEAATTLLLGSGIVFPAGTVGAAGTIALSAGDSLIAPSIILQGGSNGISLDGALLSAFSSLDISASGGGVSQLASGTISTPLLTSSNGIVGTASLMATTNAINVLGNITVTGGNFDLFDATPLTVFGDLIASGGNVLLQQGSGAALTIESPITAAATGTISLAADSLAAIDDAAFTGPGGGPVALVEIAPATKNTVPVALGVGAGLLLDDATLARIATDTLRVGAFTQPGGALDVTALSISFGGVPVDLAATAIANTLDLQANGPISQAGKGILTVGTLSGSTNGVAASSFTMPADNVIDALGSVSVTGGNFLLKDTAALTVVGAVSAGAPAAPNAANTASLSITTDGTLSIGQAGGLIGSLNAGTVVLNAQGTIAELNGSTGANTLTAQSVLGNILLTGGPDHIGTVAGLSAAGGVQVDVADPAALTLTGAISGSSLFIKNVLPGQTIALQEATLTATGATPVITLVADRLTQPATSTIVASAAGTVQLAPVSPDTNVTVGGAADTLGAVLSAITAAGTVQIGGFTVPGGAGVVTADNITLAAPLDLGPIAGTLLLQANGEVTQGPGDSLLDLGTLSGTAASFALMDPGNQIGVLFGLTASAAAGVAVADANPLTVAGTVSALAGQIFLQSFDPGGVTLALGGTLAAGTLASVEANAFTINGGTVLAGPVFELAPLAPPAPPEAMTLGTVGPGLSLVSLNGIGPDALRLGAVTVPGVGLKTTAASIAVAGAFGSPTVSLELDTLGAISQAAPLTAATLSGTAGGAVALPLGNAIGTLAAFSADGFLLNDTIQLTVTGLVSGGPSAVITDADALTIAAAGSVIATAVSLTATDISIAGLVSDGGAGTTTLVATGSVGGDDLVPGTITETGTLISGTLSGSATGAATLLGATPTTNQITDLGPFSAQGLTLDDGVDLTVVAGVSGGPGATITDAGLFTIAATGSVGASAVSLTGNSLTIVGLVTDGGAGTTTLVATGSIVDDVLVPGTITEPGTLISGTLSGSATGTASLLGATPTTNQIANLGPFSAVGLTVDDGAALNVVAAVSGDTSAVITDAGPLTELAAGSVTADAIGLTGTSLTLGGVVSDGGAGTTALFATAGTIDQTGELISGTLSGSATGAASLVGANSIANLGPFSADALTVDDGIGLTVIASVTGGPSATITDVGALTIVAAGTVSANAISLTASSITIAGLVSDGGAGTTSLIATGSGGDDGVVPGTITEPGTLISGTLSGSATRTASLLGATPTTNQIADLGPFSAVGLTLDDGAALTVVAAVSGGPSAVIADAAALTELAAGSVTANAISLTGTSLTLDGLVSDGGAGTTALFATAGTIEQTGALVSGTLSGSATGAASLVGTNSIADLGPFSADGLTVDDGIGLTVIAPVTGGPSAAIAAAGELTIVAAGSVIATAVSLTANSIFIAGLVSDGGAGTTSLTATGANGGDDPAAGTIVEPGTLISGTLSGSATRTASLLGATPTTNQIANLGPFSANGLTLDDGTALNVVAAVSGGLSAVITGAGPLTELAAGSIIANAISLTATNVTLAGLTSDGGAGTTALLAIAGTIDETGTLISGTLTGSATGAASLPGATPTTNQIATLGTFSAIGLTLDDGAALNVVAAVTGGPGAAITDSAALTVTGTASVLAQAISLNAAGITIGGLVSDGGAGSTTLIAGAGGINETGTLISGTLSGNALGAANLPGATPTTNRIADLGPFSAIGLTLDDGIGLIVGAAVSGGPAATITDAGALTVTGAGSVVAQAVNLTATGIDIAGLVSDGGAGTTQLLATTGAITETGTLISGTLSGSAPGVASLTGATPTTNQIATIGSFTATGFTLNDGANLLVGGAIAGGPSAAITDAGLLTVGGSVIGSAIDLTAGTLAIPGVVSDGGTGTTRLVTTTADITETGALTSGTLSGTAAGSASLTGSNMITALGAFSTGQALSLADTRAITVNGPVSAGTTAQLGAAAITVPGVVATGSGLTLLSSGTITETGQLVTPVLTGTAPGHVQLVGGNNQIAQINGFTAGTLTVNDATNLALNGTLTAPSIVVNDGAFQITLGNDAALVTGGITRPVGQLMTPPPLSDGGAFLNGAFRQTGNSFVTGLGGGPSILEITPGPGQNVTFDPIGGLHAPGTWLVLNLAAPSQASGNVFVKALDVFHNGTGGSANLFGTINGIGGVVAAGVGHIAPTANADFRFNNCPITSVNCIQLPIEGIPVGNPLNDFTLDTIANSNDEDDLLLPLNANDVNELLPPGVSRQDY